MAYIVSAATDHEYWANVECLDDDTELRALGSKQNTRGMKAGIPIPPEIVPRRYVVADKKMPVHGFFSCIDGTAVDDRVVSEVEALEPGMHRFHLVKITMKADGKSLLRPQFLLNCCTSVDAIDPANSLIKIKRVLPEETHPDLWYYARKMGGPLKLAVHRDRIAGRAMWWDNRFKRMFFSDALIAALQTAGVEGNATQPARRRDLSPIAPARIAPLGKRRA